MLLNFFSICKTLAKNKASYTSYRRKRSK